MVYFLVEAVIVVPSSRHAGRNAASETSPAGFETASMELLYFRVDFSLISFVVPPQLISFEMTSVKLRRASSCRAQPRHLVRHDAAINTISV